MSHHDEWDNTTDVRQASQGGEEGRSEVGQRILGILRRQWKMAAAVALVAVPALGFVGWQTGKVQYTSTATVHVRPTVQTVLYRDEDKGVMPMYDSFVNTQMELLRNPRVIDLAVQDRRWQAAYGSATAEKVAEFLDKLTVLRKGELVYLSVAGDTPMSAQAGALSVIGAFSQIYVKQDNDADEQRLTALQQRQTSLNSEVSAIRQKIIAAANTFGTEDLDPLYQSRREQTSQLELEIQKLRLLSPSSQPTTQPTEARAITTPAEAAAVDKVIADLINQRNLIVRSDKVMADSGMMSSHRNRLKNASEIAAMDRAIEDRFQELREQGLLERLSVGSSENTAERIKQLDTLLEQARTDLLALGRQQMVINELRREETRLRDELDRVKRRIDQLNIESTTAGRLRIVGEGSLPVRPSKDSRIRNAGLGGFGGLLLALAGIVGVGLMQKRIGSLDEVTPHDTSGPVLGVLPEIPEGLEDPALAAQAAHNVHHIRTMLEVWSNGRAPLSLTVTSPSSGSGKTSLTLALGVSFSAAGLRTLLIDLDVIGGGLTSRFEAMTRRRLGVLLVAKGVITDVQRIEALKSAAETGLKIGETCVRLGYATEIQIKEALQSQAAEFRKAGVIEALEGKPVRDCLTDSGITGLDVMCLGSADMSHATSISTQRIRRLIQRAGEEYDVILIDTGPVPGSLEAGSTTVATDGTVLAIARGDERVAVSQCVGYLGRIGARVAGVVFNRATMRDMARLSASRSSNYGSMPRSTPRLSFDDSIEAPTPEETQRMGPVAGAVASTIRPARGDEQQRSAG